MGAGEEMGLGKTVEIAALVLSNPAPPPLQTEDETTAEGLIVSRCMPLLAACLRPC